MIRFGGEPGARMCRGWKEIARGRGTSRTWRSRCSPLQCWGDLGCQSVQWLLDPSNNGDYPMGMIDDNLTSNAKTLDDQEEVEPDTY